MTIHICVGALMLRDREEPQILLGHRSPDRAFYPDVWDMPGGHCEPGEMPEQTLTRELREEIGVVPTVWRWLGDLQGSPDGNDTVLVHIYAVTAWVGAPVNRLPTEHTAIAWFSISDACALSLAHPDYPRLFRQWFLSENSKD